MTRKNLLLAAAGLMLLVYLLAREGASDIFADLASAGWNLLWVPLYYLLPLGLATRAWACLFDSSSRPFWWKLGQARWAGESINTLLPVAQVGGHFVRARMIIGARTSSAQAGASVVVDFTLGLMTQLIFTLLGCVLLLSLHGGVEPAPLFSGLAAALLLLAGFYGVQRLGLFSGALHWLPRLQKNHRLSSLVGGARELDRHIARLYRRKGSVTACGAWRFVAWLARSGESWLILFLLGSPLPLADALVLESLSAGVRSVAFAVPGALGVQEGGILLIGGMLGLSPETALAVGLAKRVRELVLGMPGMILWFLAEGRDG